MDPSPSGPAAPALRNPKSLDLLAGAAAWRLLGMLFQPPSPVWREELPVLAAEAHDAELSSAASAAQQASEGLYYTLFGPGGPVSLREVSHRPTVDAGQFLAELADLYAAFGYHPAEAEPQDHVAAEVGFVAYLLLKEAFALEQGQPQQTALAACCAEQFIAQHVAVLARALATHLADAPVPYLAQAAAILARYASATPA